MNCGAEKDEGGGEGRGETLREGLWESAASTISRVGLILGGAATCTPTGDSSSETWVSGSNWAGRLRGTAAPRVVPGPSSPQLGPSV